MRSATATIPLLKIALELERIALQDDYFIEKKLYPNIDFYSGITLRAMGFPVELFTVLFAVARTVGWIAQWKEMIEDPEQRIGRPRQLYVGPPRRDLPGRLIGDNRKHDLGRRHRSDLRRQDAAFSGVSGQGPRAASWRASRSPSKRHDARPQAFPAVHASCRYSG